MRFQLHINKRELAIVCSSLVICVCAMVGWRYLEVDFTGETPERAKHGWAGPQAVAEAQPIVAAMPAFQITDADGRPIRQDNAKANVRLWAAVLEQNGGRHLPNVPQEIGDCVSWGAKHAVEYLIFCEIKANPGSLEFHEVFAPYIYGTARVNVGGGKIKGDGAVGAWAARAVTEYGILRSDFPGTPAYSGSVARQWGKEGPPEAFVREARRFPVETTSPVRTATEIRDAICNGYPCTIASDAGFDRIRPRDGRLVGERSGKWSHQMCVIAYDGQTGSEPYFYVLNSWGENAHGRPLDDSPPGGFWIVEKDMQYIAKQGDSFAFSSFAGFKAREFDFHLFGHHRQRSRRNTNQNTMASIANTKVIQSAISRFDFTLAF